MRPRVLLVGKTRSLVQWLEDARDGFEDAGAVSPLFALNGNTPLTAMRARVARLRGPSALTAHLAGQLDAALGTHAPQLVLFMSAYWASSALADVVRAHDIPLAGWVGDRFDASAAAMATRLDRVYYTDSGFLAEAKQFGFPDNGCYLPHAANSRLFRPGNVNRNNQIVFVAVPTRHRLELLKQIDTPIAVYGRRWKAIGPTPHEIHDRWLARKRLPRLYQESLAVLNVRNELNVLEGLNQRSFEPPACGSPVLHDALADLDRCFDPGKEVLVFHNSEELQDLCGRLGRDPALAHRIGAAALARVQGQHTCAHRARTILRDFALA